MTTPAASAISPIRTPRKSIKNPMIKVAKIFGKANIV
jgi:hypothetical protein